ncbi:MAG: hypothetical protein IKT70_05350 [Clostridia bacterium]|nr:hypothetical protein [Clostridia bacterium]
MKNIIPSFSSGKWSVWAAFENKKPVSTISDTELTLMANAYSDAGKWVCTFDVTPGMDYNFSFDIKTERIEYQRSCVRAMAVWQDDTGEMLRCDYAINEEKLDKNTFRMSKHITAPKIDARYKKDAVQVTVELLLWNTDNGKATFFNPVFEETDPVVHRKVKVATTYINPYVDDAKTYEDRVAKILRTADNAGALSPDIIAFSEFIATRELRMSKPEASQTIPGPLTNLLSEKARKYNCYIMFNMAEEENGFYYNTSVLIDRQGNIAGKYRKVHLTYRECLTGTTPGRDYPVFETDFGKIGFAICFDHFFPESVRQLTLNGAEIIFVSTAGDGYMQSTARAQDNGVPMVISCVNHAKASPWPQSRIVGADGVIIAGTMDDCGAAVATLDLDDPFIAFWFSVGSAYSVKHDNYMAEARPDTYLK